ncbi:BnaC04g51490D [Brassica napus]|uniref:BnaC04g51490D protein n=1 Tax=Brassica napus TaxID=3708 RepID=A0A078GSC0_BRANA|nr:BnaC04g51490D [Brassica napus]
MADTVKPILISAVDLGVRVIQASNEAKVFKKEWDVVKIKVQKLLELLEKALTASSNLCEFPTRHVISIAEAVLQKSLAVLDKCTPKLRNRVLTIIRVSTSQKMLVRLERSIINVSWLLNVSTPSHDGKHEQLTGLPPFAIRDPTLFLIYELMAILYTGTLDDDACETARSLRSMASDNPRCAEIMIRNEDTQLSSARNLARSFRASDTSMIEQLVKLLGHRDPEVLREAIVALTKFASPCNYFHIDHSRAIVEAGAARRLIELSSLGCEIRIPALELLICIAVHVPEKEQVMEVLECASKQPFE